MAECTASDRLQLVRHIAFDMDGTIYLGDGLFDATPRLLALLDRLGISYSFLTNNSSYSSREYLDRLARLGLSIRPDQLYTSTHATAEYLRLHYPLVRRLYVLGTDGMQRELASMGFDLCDEESEPDAVTVGFDRTMQYGRLCRATWWVAQGKPYLASHPDRVCPTDQPTVLVDCGSICAAIEHAVGRAPDAVVGKPDPRMLEGLFRGRGLAAAQVAVVGDRLSTDMALARRSGAVAVLTLTGEATRAEAVDHEHAPDVIVENLDELGRLLQEGRR